MTMANESLAFNRTGLEAGAFEFPSENEAHGIEVFDEEHSGAFAMIFEFIIPGVLLNTIGLLGLVGNLISIIVLSRPQMKSSINCILIGLATFDSILIVTSILMFGFPAVYAYTQSVFDYYFFHLFPYMTPFMYPIGMIAQTGSAYLTLCVTLERYVAVCLPLQARSLCTYTRACWYVFGITLFAGVYNLPRFWEVSWYSYFDPEVNQTRTDIIPTALRDNQVYISVYITWMYLVVMYIIPFCSLAVFNLIIYHEVRRANSERARLTRLQQKEIGLATMLMVVVIAFFLCNVLALVVNILELNQINMMPLNNVSNMLITLNSSLNFIIYCIFGEKFKRIFFRLFCPTIVKAKTTSEYMQRYPIGANANNRSPPVPLITPAFTPNHRHQARGHGHPRLAPSERDGVAANENHPERGPPSALRGRPAVVLSSIRDSRGRPRGPFHRQNKKRSTVILEELLPLSATETRGTQNHGKGANHVPTTDAIERNGLDHPACSSSSSNADSSGTLQTRRKLRLKAIQLNRDDCCCSLSSSPSPPSPKRPIVTKQGRLYCCLCCGGWSKFGSLSPSKWNHRSPSSNHSRTPGSTFVFHRQTLRTTITASVDEPLEFDEHGTGVDFKYPEDHVRLLDHNESRRIHCGSMDCKHSQEEHDDDYEGKEDMGTDNFARGGSHSTRNRLATRPLKCLKSDPNKECPDLGQQCNRQDITITVNINAPSVSKVGSSSPPPPPRVSKPATSTPTLASPSSQSMSEHLDVNQLPGRATAFIHPHHPLQNHCRLKKSGCGSLPEVLATSSGTNNPKLSIPVDMEYNDASPESSPSQGLRNDSTKANILNNNPRASILHSGDTDLMDTRLAERDLCRDDNQVDEHEGMKDEEGAVNNTSQVKNWNHHHQAKLKGETTSITIVPRGTTDFAVGCGETRNVTDEEKFQLHRNTPEH